MNPLLRNAKMFVKKKTNNGRLNNRFCCIFLSIFCYLNGCARFPSDEMMIAHFRANKGDFERLLSMFRNDKELARIGEDFTDPAVIVIRQERLREYRNLLKQLDIYSLGGSTEKDFVKLHSHSVGLSISGRAKGYVYSEEIPRLVVDDLDAYFAKHKRSSFTAYRSIEGNWYLFYDSEI